MASKSAVRPPELTFRGILLGCFITLLFTAANLYLGLRVGLTIATSIPAAVISMALLRNFKNANIFENNIVQTIASAAGTLSSIGYVLPGLIMIGWWTGFSFWMSFWICALGGLLGVLFSVPLRRALVTGSDLPYPEGVAAAAVLKVGTDTLEGVAESKAGLRVIVVGSLVSAFYSALAATQIASAEVTKWFRVGPTGTGVDASMSFALIGAGHLVGLTVGLAIMWGLVLGFGIVTPLLAYWAHTPDAAQSIWAHQVRFFGAGVIGVAALWTLATLIMPIVGGLRESLAASRARKAGTEILAIEEQDIPVPMLGVGLLILLVPMAITMYVFLQSGPLSQMTWPLIGIGLVYVLIAGAIVAAVCGYMAGLIGASNSPVSGLGILGVVGAGLTLLFLAKPYLPAIAVPHLVAFALFLTALIFSTATISNDNLQDLKTGQLVGATPWKQQVALMIGVLAGSAVIPFTFNLLNQAYGFAPLTGIARPHALPAPQATLISTLAKGVLGAGLDWNLIGSGVAVGLVLILVDGLLGKMGWRRVPPLAVGLGIYLPMGATLPVVIGAVIGHLYEKRTRTEVASRVGVLLASGFIVGDGLFGVALAGLIVVTGSGTPLGLVGDSFETPAMFVGLAVFGAIIAYCYRWIARISARLE
ncbi:MAG: oligopeptide transporter, OPT family [Sphingomonas sp.]|nr:oligopeptide transporter, OPT family [Sphingomonas sp.]